MKQQPLLQKHTSQNMIVVSLSLSSGIKKSIVKCIDANCVIWFLQDYEVVDEEGGENEEWEKEIDQMLEDEVEENTKLMDWPTMLGKLDATIIWC